MNGIIEFHDTLLRADCVNVEVTTNNENVELTYENCSLADFRDAWRKALDY
jgi:hypothetical protein